MSHSHVREEYTVDAFQCFYWVEVWDIVQKDDGMKKVKDLQRTEETCPCVVVNSNEEWKNSILLWRIIRLDSMSSPHLETNKTQDNDYKYGHLPEKRSWYCTSMFLTFLLPYVMYEWFVSEVHTQFLPK